MSAKTAVYPGTFDPMTLGHFDLITRAAKLYDRLIVAVAATSAKNGALFDAEHRIAMIREDVANAGLENVSVELLDTLLVDFCRSHGVRTVIRGVRVYSDFEYEFQMALTHAVHDAVRKPGLRHRVHRARDRPLRRRHLAFRNPSRPEAPA